MIKTYPLPPRTQLSIKGIPMSINILPPTLPGCGILNFVKNWNAQMLGSLNAEKKKNGTKFPLVIDFIKFFCSSVRDSQTVVLVQPQDTACMLKP